MGLVAFVTGALTIVGLAAGAGGAHATIGTVTCGPADDGAARTLVTETGAWNQVCLGTGVTEDAHTAHKSDAFDGFGFLFFRYGAPDAVPLQADGEPDVQEIGGDELIVTWSDLDVAWAPADFVDVFVTRSIKGSTQNWTFTILDSDDGQPRSDVRVDLLGYLGSEEDARYESNGGAMIAYGDEGDPIVIMQAHGRAGSYVRNGGEGDFVVSAYAIGSGSRIDVAMVDYDCNNTLQAPGYAYELAGTDLAELYGQTLAAPGTEGCFTTPSPIYLEPGAEFDIPVELAFGPEFDFTDGGFVQAAESNLEVNGADWGSFETTDVFEPGVAPSLRFSGTAPTEPGAYFFNVYARSNGEGFVQDVRLVQVIIGAPPAPPAEPGGTTPAKLAATGSTASPSLMAIAAISAVLGAAALLIARRRRAS
jgi:LPXTG-motif cell wall-anchored protein